MGEEAPNPSIQYSPRTCYPHATWVEHGGQGQGPARKRWRSNPSRAQEVEIESINLSPEDNYERHVSPEDKEKCWKKYCSGVKNREHQGNELWIIPAVNVFRRPIRIVSSYSCGKVTCRAYTLRDGNVTRVDHAPGVLFSSQETTAPGNEPMNLLQYMGETFSAGHYRVLVNYAVEPLLNKGFFPWMP